MPTAPEVLVREIEGVIVKPAVAELRKASFASKVFIPAGRAGAVVAHEKEPLPSDMQPPVSTRLMPLMFALMS